VETGWISAGWHSSRQMANVTASELCVGVGLDVDPYLFGDIWGPPRNDDDLPKRALFDLVPDRLVDEPFGPTLVEPATA